MLFRSFVLLFACLVLPAFAQAQVDDPEAVYHELQALEGTWFMPTDRGDRLEVWRVQDDSTMTGRGLRIRIENGDTVTLETLRLELRDTNILYTAIVRGQNQNRPVTFRLTVADEDGYLFENPQHDDPQKIRYRLLGRRELQVTTEGRRNGRTTKQEFTFEREFTPTASEFRVRAGLGASMLRGTGNFGLLTGISATPDYGPGATWEVGTQLALRGRGGFLTLNFELDIMGRSSTAFSEFNTTAFDTLTGQPIVNRRDVRYHSVWLMLAFTPELTFRRDGRFSIIVGPYVAQMLGNRAKGVQEPTSGVRLSDANNDFKRTDIGLLGGAQYKLNFGKKDVGGVIGLRASLGLKNIDNLYARDRGNTALYTAQVTMSSIVLYYSVNLLKL